VTYDKRLEVVEARSQNPDALQWAVKLWRGKRDILQQPYPTFKDMNNLSLVTFLEYDGCGIVIPGDLERAGVGGNF
jgi:hypothetical protein